MHCIVTAGPTHEPLDEVRHLTNFSTGRLGIELGNFLSARRHRVTLLAGAQATYRGERRAEHVEIFSTTADLRARLQALAAGGADAIFHAAAVSDFAFGDVFDPAAPGKLAPIKGRKKITSRGGKLLVELLPTPKILRELRGWFPAARIAGWKFEADGGRADAIAAARRQLAECSTDLCVVNGPAYSEGFGLIGVNGPPVHLADAPALFETLEKMIP
ncbi:MAG: DNA/pantothenate metabolism flavoprotein domain protein [Verrucomicrobia bacterium]|nr:DNA/pantothenate metabolism flavoprotein domain protein [Verrucomicrobiota bacterium]MDE3100191.1 DNA/pantothenate metabolism flavoprotein domain protein [Verrucomicrobiota bacterium]